MAQNYEIDVKRFNGQDYDTLLPTPASHASTHQADGSDPLTLQAGNYGDSSIPTSAYQNASVSRAKLAQDALYSPVKRVDTAEYNLNVGHTGFTIIDQYGLRDSALTWSISKEVADAFPVGAEIAFLRSYNNVGITIQITGARVINVDSGRVGSAAGTVSFSLPEKGSMCALKKLENDSTYGSFWILTGNVEVIS